MKYISIDRFEGEFAICLDEEEKKFKIKIKDLPKKVKEGDILKVLDGFKFKIDREKTKNIVSLKLDVRIHMATCIKVY